MPRQNLKNASVEIPAGLYRSARAEARRNNMSFSKWVRSLIRRELDGATAKGESR